MLRLYDKEIDNNRLLTKHLISKKSFQWVIDFYLTF